MQYKKVLNAAGEPEFVEMTAEEIAESVKAHPLYGARKQEAIENRLKLKADKASAQPDTEEDAPAPQVTATPAQPQPAAPVVDIDAIVARAVADAVAAIDNRSAAERQRDQTLNTLLSTNNLPLEARSVLERSNDPEATAKELARLRLNFGSGGASEVSREDAAKSIADAAMKSLNLA